jgi:hypothetical protein
VHNSICHTASECREIKKLMEQFCEKMQQQRQDACLPGTERASRRWTPRRRKTQRWSFRTPRGH